MNRCFSRVLPALALVVALGTSGVAAAQDNNRPGPGLTPDQRAKVVRMYKDYRKDTQEMRTKLYAKRLALEALAGNGNADPKRIEELAQEIADLRTKLEEKRMDMREAMQKEFGIPAYGPYRFDDRGPAGPGPKGDRRGPGDDGRRGPGYGPHHRGHQWMMDWEYYMDRAEDFPPMM